MVRHWCSLTGAGPGDVVTGWDDDREADQVAELRCSPRLVRVDQLDPDQCVVDGNLLSQGVEVFDVAPDAHGYIAANRSVTVTAWSFA